MNAFPLAASLCLAAALLAGCAGGSDAPAAGDEEFDDLGLQATSSTGVLRGVVVDDAIRPLANASVRLSGPTPGEASTNADGLFGFSALQPGTYFVQVSKAGFNATQTSADVVAGVTDPPVLRVLLAANPSTAPYVQTLVFDGYIECSGSFVAFGLAACNALELPNDVFMAEYTLDRPPHFVQSEAVWESTQAISPGLSVVYSYPGEDVLYTNYVEAEGPSPLLLQANASVAAAAGDGLGNGTDLTIRVFNAPIEGTSPPDPVGGDDCVDRPGLGGCATGVGVTVQQAFSIFTTVFYGFTPADGWWFTVDGPHPPPA